LDYVAHILLISSTGRVPVSLVSESEDPDDDGDAADTRELVDKDLSDDLDDKEGDADGEDEEDEARGYRDEDVEGTREEAERIRFSRKKDLQSYRAASRSRSTAGFGDSRGYRRSYDQDHDQGRDQGRYQGYDQEEENERIEENSKDELRERILTLSLNRESIQVVPAIIFLSLIFALVLTFYTESIPEYPGALASSILIVTLIIYGAATLLKA
jgi:hypothetical protein